MTTKTIHATTPTDRPGLSLQTVLQKMPEGDRLPFLAYLVQRAQQARDAEILEAIRDYRLLVDGKPHVRAISSSA